MSFALFLKKSPRGEPDARLAACPQFSDNGWHCPNRQMAGLSVAMDCIGLFREGSAPPSSFGQTSAKKFASHDGHAISEAEAGAIAGAVAELIEDESDLEFVFDVWLEGLPDDVELSDAEIDKLCEGLVETLKSWAAFNRLAATAGGYTVS